MGYVHHEDPFRSPEGDRSPARRFRGRLVSPVTLWTSGTTGCEAGLTIGSILVAEGEPPHVLGLVNDLTDLFDRIEETQRFVVHLLESDHRALAERFAGLRPSPGGPFHSLEAEETPWGPAIGALPNRVYCRAVEVTSPGYQRLVRGEIERFDIEELGDPLVHFRGRYRSLGP